MNRSSADRSSAGGSSEDRPSLAPPGAGLPLPELWIARALFAVRRWTGSRATFDAAFAAERARIAARVRDLDPERGARRVLIARPAGLEDSSRDWSVWMTLDHLRIVNKGIAGLIVGLASDKPPRGVSSTAAVKPPAGVGPEVVTAYEAACDQVLAAARSVADLHTAARFEHPWFGPMDAAGWHALAATHMRIHRVQIERILG